MNMGCLCKTILLVANYDDFTLTLVNFWGLFGLIYALGMPRSVCIASTMSSQALAFSAGLRSRTLGW